MSQKAYHAASFIVRIWWEKSHDENLSWRGQVIHTQSQQSVYVDDIPKLIKFLEHWSGTLEPGKADESYGANGPTSANQQDSE